MTDTATNNLPCAESPDRATGGSVPLLVIISAPSGAGKSTLIHNLVRRMPTCALSISHTTRAPRVGEKEGVDYYFVDDAGFEAVGSEYGFAEHAEVHGNRYGTSCGEIDRIRALHRHVILDVDVQGAAQLRVVYPDAVSVFVLPPSMAELARRLTSRGTDAPDVIKRRLARARAEIEQALEYDFAVVNDDIERSSSTLTGIVRAQMQRACAYSATVERLLREPLWGE